MLKLIPTRSQSTWAAPSAVSTSARPATRPPLCPYQRGHVMHQLAGEAPHNSPPAAPAPPPLPLCLVRLLEVLSHPAVAVDITALATPLVSNLRLIIKQVNLVFFFFYGGLAVGLMTTVAVFCIWSTLCIRKLWMKYARRKKEYPPVLRDDAQSSSPKFPSYWSQQAVTKRASSVDVQWTRVSASCTYV